MRHWMPLTLSLVLALSVGACSKKDQPTELPDEDLTTELDEVPAEEIVPMLTAEQVEVEYRERELAEGRALEEGERFEVEPGANVVTSEGGRASLVWDGFLSQHLLDGTDTLLSLSQPDMRYAILDQATGTARYELLGAGEAATVTIKAASWTDVQLNEGEAEIIVSIVPGTEPASWIAVLEGEATVLRSEDSLTLTKGQVASFTADGDMPLASTVDGELLGDWYDDVEAGNVVGNMASIAYRCEVTAEEAVVYAAPDEDADTVGDPLAQGTSVVVIQRDEPGTYVRVTDERFFEALKDTASGEMPEDLLDGWVASADLSCNGPTTGVSMDPPEELGDKATATPLPLPTRLPYVAPTLIPTLAVTFTPTPTPTAAASTVEFWAEDDEIDLGECTNLRWKFRNIKAWYLDGSGGAGDDGKKEVCPKKTTTYNVKVIRPDDSEVKKSATVKVRMPEDATATPRATATQAGPQASPTTMAVATTAVPTQPPPTNTPEPPPPSETPEPPPPSETPVPPPPSDTPEPPPPSDTPEPDPTDPAPAGL